MRYGRRALSACLLAAAPAAAQEPGGAPAAMNPNIMTSVFAQVPAPAPAGGALAPAGGVPAPAAPAPFTVTEVTPPPGGPDPMAALAGEPDTYGGPRVWGSVDYLIWYVRTQAAPDLIQSVPSATALASVNGGTNLPPGSTQSIFPGSNGRIDFGASSGVRGTVGFAFDRIGVEVSGFALERNSTGASASNNGFPFAIAQMYTSAGTGQNTSLYASLPGEYSGGAYADADTRFWGVDGNVRVPWYALLADTNNALAGVRYLDLREGLDVGSRSVFPDGTALSVRDTVRTRNEFFGGQVGLASRYGAIERGLGLDSLLKFGMGGVRQQATLTGSNSFSVPGLPTDTANGGLYVQPSNAGTHTRTKFAVSAEYDLNLTYNFSRAAQVYVGYSVIYLSSVLRPASTLDLTINDSRVRYVATPAMSNSARPAFNFGDSDFVAQGVNFGVKFQY